ncbi:hypothetical protein JKF63_01198 [Porcisia hertigi]|uniref:SH3 domain-containing protein n=1 Tax=Porcisia hertigi TaxID=2761500 RepID=A0A836KZE0_9TRYP|nr:hypothetical protein JKF63_01198 [Porcisia hertigi]
MNSLRRSPRERRYPIGEPGIDAGDTAEAAPGCGGADSRTSRGTGSGAKPHHAPSEQSTEQCIALIDYDALHDDELSFRAGDVINVTGKGSASGFWEGYVVNTTSSAVATAEPSSAENSNSLLHFSGASWLPPHSRRCSTRGFFPNCLVTSNMGLQYAMSHSVAQNVALCLYPYNAIGEGEMSFVVGDVITAVRPSSSPGWWYGIKSSGPVWVAPSRTRVSPLPAAASTRFADPAAAAASSSSHTERKVQTFVDASPRDGTGTLADHGKEEERLFPTNFVTCDVVQVRFDFTSRQPHELSCRSGDVIQVHRRWNDGWWEGTLRGRRGIFPSNYTIPNITTTTPPLFCARCRTIFASFLFPSTCATCAAEERVEGAMVQAMEAYLRGETTELDLFAKVDIRLTTFSETSCANVGDARGDGAPSDFSHEVSIGTSHNRRRGSTTSTASTCDGEGLSRQRHPGHRGSVPPEARVPLLTEKDIADLACNRVKLIE